VQVGARTAQQPARRQAALRQYGRAPAVLEVFSGCGRATAASDSADDRSSGAVVLPLNQNLLALLLGNRHHSWRDLQDVSDFLRLRWVLDLALNLGLGLLEYARREHGETD
jgi:hypothetical protein